MIFAIAHRSAASHSDGHGALALLLLCSGAFSQSPPGDLRPKMDLPAETVGVDRIVSTLISAFDRVDVVALDDTHQRKVDSDIRIRLIRDPEFTQKVHLIIVEFANIADQSILDGYINGEDIPLAQLQHVWRNTCCPRSGTRRSMPNFLQQSGM